jgi:hypothetical protein
MDAGMQRSYTLRYELVWRGQPPCHPLCLDSASFYRSRLA